VQDRTALEAAASALTSDPGNPDAPPEDFPKATLQVESPPELVAGSVTGHRFLHAPVARGEKLFVLTHAGEQYWLNRLERSSGRVVWQQPVCFSSESPEDDLAGSPIAGTNICLLVGDLVICCLQHGVLIGVETDDGRLMWASTVLDEPEKSPVPGFGIPQRFRHYDEPSPVVMLPAVSSGLLIGSHPDSRFVSAVDARSGEILWRSPKSPHGVEPGGRNSDWLIAGVTADQVILTGERYCRSLDLRSGRQNWIVESDAVGGRPECNDQRCLVPLADGRVQVIDVSSGSLVSPPSVMTLPARLPVSGAICGNEDIVVLSSPASVSAFARSAVMQRATLPEWAASSVRDGELPVLRRTQSMLMAGDLSGAQQLLESQQEPASIALESPDANRVWMEVGAARAELMLQSWGQELESARTGDARSSSVNHGDRMQRLAALPLRPDQELRAAVLSLLERPSTALDAETVAGLASYSDWKRPVLLHGSWRTRPDRLLADRLSVATADATAREVAFGELSRKAARELAAGWILEPSHAHDAQAIAALADWFAARADAGTAELLLLSATQSDSLSESSRTELQSALKGLRSRNCIPGLTPSQGGTSEGALSSGLRGLTADVAERSSLKIEVEPFLRLPSPEWTELQGGVRLVGLPEHLRLDYYFSSGEDSNAVELVSLDPADGTIRDRIPVTAAISRQTLTMTPLESGESCPALFPVADRGRMEMFQLAAPGEAGLLWQRKLNAPSDPRAERPVEFGPIGADHLVWASDGVLHGTHPLTGEDLWTRSLLWTWDEAPLLRTHRIFGDAKATVVLSSDGSGCERFATRTGEKLGRGSLAISRTHEPLAVGRFVAFVSTDGVLQVIDGADGRDILADETPVRIARQNSARTFSLLPRGRFATVNDQNEVILVDTQRGGIVFRTNVGEYLSTSLVFGVTAFERHGRLFVGLDDEQDRPGDMLVQFSRLADPRLGLGPLLCLNPESGEVQWSVRTERAVVPRIAGDPTDLLVTWTLYRPSFQSRTDGDGDRLNIRVFDSRSGRELASEASLSTAAPFRCSHDADAGVIRLFTRDCEITIRPLRDGETPDQRP
jgi:outer membrane protein assembly factor BamB